MAQINRLARGFTGLLDGKAGDIAPREVAEFLQPTMDLLMFYALEKGWKVSGASGGVGAVGQGVFATVPNGEAWLMVQAHARYTYGNGTQKASVGVILENLPIRGGGNSTLLIATSGGIDQARNSLAGGQEYAEWTQGNTMILPSGTRVRAQLLDQRGAFVAGETINLQVMYAQVGSFPGAATLFA